MRVDISGVIQGSPSMKGKSASFRLHGGGPYLYAYGQFGEHIVGKIADGSAILASGSVNYAKDGGGNWEKYINITGGLTVLPNKKISEDEKAKLTFVTAGKITSITPQQVKSGNMAKFTVEEVSIDFRGDTTIKHSMVAFEDTADLVLSLQEGQNVMVAGTIGRVKGRNDDWYTSFTATAVVSVETVAPVAPAPVAAQAEAPAQTSVQDELPF